MSITLDAALKTIEELKDEIKRLKASNRDLERENAVMYFDLQCCQPSIPLAEMLKKNDDDGPDAIDIYDDDEDDVRTNKRCRN
jgi:hypothetical protein